MITETGKPSKPLSPTKIHHHLQKVANTKRGAGDGGDAVTSLFLGIFKIFKNLIKIYLKYVQLIFYKSVLKF